MPFRITMAIEWTGQGIVTSDPVFVEVLAGAADNGKWVAPGGSSIGRKADQDRNAITANNGIVRNHPGTMISIIGHRRIFHPIIQAFYRLRRMREEAIRPGSAAIRG